MHRYLSVVTGVVLFCVVGAASPMVLAQPAADASASAKKTQTTNTGDQSEISTPGVYVQDLLEAVPPTGTAITKLDVDNRLGDVRIVGHDGHGLSIFAVKHAPDATTLERLEVKLVQDPAGPVSIRTGLAAGDNAITAGSARIDLVVRVPRSASVSASVWNGKLRISGMENGADANANDGSIHLERVAGRVTAASGAGSQKFEKIRGRLDAQTVDGDVDVDTLRGERLAASVTNGSVTAKSVIVREMFIRVVKGDIRVQAEVVAGGTYQIASMTGDVQVHLTGDAKTKVSAEARRGEISLPKRFKPQSSSANEVVGYLGSGKNPAHIQLRTRTGNVVLAKF